MDPIDLGQKIWRFFRGSGRKKRRIGGGDGDGDDDDEDDEDQVRLAPPLKDAEICAPYSAAYSRKRDFDEEAVIDPNNWEVTRAEDPPLAKLLLADGFRLFKDHQWRAYINKVWLEAGAVYGVAHEQGALKKTWEVMRDFHPTFSYRIGGRGAQKHLQAVMRLRALRSKSKHGKTTVRNNHVRALLDIHEFHLRTSLRYRVEQRVAGLVRRAAGRDDPYQEMRDQLAGKEKKKKRKKKKRRGVLARLPFGLGSRLGSSKDEAKKKKKKKKAKKKAASLSDAENGEAGETDEGEEEEEGDEEAKAKAAKKKRKKAKKKAKKAAKKAAEESTDDETTDGGGTTDEGEPETKDDDAAPETDEPEAKADDEPEPEADAGAGTDEEHKREKKEKKKKKKDKKKKKAKKGTKVAVEAADDVEVEDL